MIAANDVDSDSITYEISGVDAMNLILTKAQESYNLMLHQIMRQRLRIRNHGQMAQIVHLKRFKLALMIWMILRLFLPHRRVCCRGKSTSIGTVTVNDVDSDNSSIEFEITGSIVISSSGLSFVEAPDYEVKSLYQATVTASDGINAASQAITVTIIDANECSHIRLFLLFKLRESTLIGTNC